jgi:hypothetical protein
MNKAELLSWYHDNHAKLLEYIKDPSDDCKISKELERVTHEAKAFDNIRAWYPKESKAIKAFFKFQQNNVMISRIRAYKTVMDDLDATDEAKAAAYDKFWNDPQLKQGTELAAKIKRPRKPNDADAKHMRFILTKKLKSLAVLQLPPHEYIVPHDLIQEEYSLNTMLNVISTQTMFDVWAYDKKATRPTLFKVTHANSHLTTAIFSVIEDERGPECKLVSPGIGKNPALCIVYLKKYNPEAVDFSFAHEVAHVVLHAMKPFYELTPGDHETFAMMIERLCRHDLCCLDKKTYDDLQLCRPSPVFEKRQLAIALADLNSETPAEFNANYAKYLDLDLTKSGNVVAMFPQWARTPYEYYKYVIGMLRNPSSTMLNFGKRHDIYKLMTGHEYPH